MVCVSFVVRIEGGRGRTGGAPEVGWFGGGASFARAADEEEDGESAQNQPMVDDRAVQ